MKFEFIRAESMEFFYVGGVNHPAMEVTARLEEAIKQTRLAKQEVERSEASQYLEQGLESLQDGLESLEKEDEG